MAKLQIIYWRDIPAQVIVRKGRKAAKRPLPPRFEAAIDRAAMRSGLAGTDDYLSEWRRSTPVQCSDDLEAEAEAAFETIDSEYDSFRLKTLVDNGGKD